MKSCVNNFFESTAVASNQHDLITLTVSEIDVYNFLVDVATVGTAISLLSGNLNAVNPCENVLGGSDSASF